MEEDENGIGEWRGFMLSPQGLFSGLSSESCFTKQVFEVPSGGEYAIATHNAREVEKSGLNFEKEEEQCENEATALIGLENRGIRSAGSIAERRAAKCGFNASKINTPRFRSSSLLASPAARSPCLTIPPGVSPTTLLDSPIMLPNFQASPTTGTFALPHLDLDSAMIFSAPEIENGNKGSDGDSAFRFNPLASPVSLACFQVSSTNDAAGSLGVELDHRTLASVPPAMEFQHPARFPGDSSTKIYDTDSPPDTTMLNDMAMNANSPTMQPCHDTSVSGDGMRNNNEPTQGEDAIAAHTMDEEQNRACPPMGNVRTSEDGFNWRKYGQKQVKGSEYPRSYYKCTHPNCLVKKKVERSQDGQITEIIYTGAHCHPKPQPSRRTTYGSSVSFSEVSELGEGGDPCVKADGGPIWRSIPDGLERTSSTSVVTQVSDPLSTTEGKRVGMLESTETPELSSTLASHEDEEEDAATLGSMYLADNDDDNEFNSKRRKMESSLIEMTLGSRAVREPRVVVQIESDVDILDDGYRWRKYGQKVVKGNPNPRSYYKCTSAGCMVRKHVERASHNLKFVITTYEGKHNHEVPAVRNSSQPNSIGGNLPPTAPNTQESLTLPINTHIPKPEPQDFALSFNRSMEYINEYLMPSYLGNLGASASSFYPMKFPTVPSTISDSSFRPNFTDYETYPGHIIPYLPDFSMPMPLGFPCSSNSTISSYNHHERPPAPVQNFAGQEIKDSGMKLLSSKQEPREEPFCDEVRINPSSSHSIYGNIMGSFPS
ncbi:hypothetical protein Nepgr_012198 [Nepenthes gracilis]|uniref:WRKY domain-containing protein n=1 Tax=Nepenthes gracilis TaxID=150966 RepID=A0AAD3SFP6_NEPGR|nr:hypothetical protein Nepgr_012198 [Nepenthes gracilis]